MAMPNPFQKLKHGVLLCKKNFNTFVETFNFLVDFAQNIKGDGDANGNGTIVFDRTVPDRPVIRSKINFDYPFGEEKEQVPEPFDIVEGVVVNCSIPCPVTVITASDYTITSSSSDIYLHINYSNGSYTATVNQTSQANTTTHAQFKLYEYENDAIVRDWRPKALPLFAL